MSILVELLYRGIPHDGEFNDVSGWFEEKYSFFELAYEDDAFELRESLSLTKKLKSFKNELMDLCVDMMYRLKAKDKKRLRFEEFMNNE